METNYGRERRSMYDKGLTELTPTELEERTEVFDDFNGFNSVPRVKEEPGVASAKVNFFQFFSSYHPNIIIVYVLYYPHRRKPMMIRGKPPRTGA
jgi:hypothetical protein